MIGSTLIWLNYLPQDVLEDDKLSGGPWQVVRTDFVLDYPIAFTPQQTESLTISGKLELVLKDVRKSLSDAAVLFDGNQRSHNATGHFLDPSLKIIACGKKDSGKKSKGKSSKNHSRAEHDEDEANKTAENQRKEYTADILLGAFEAYDSAEEEDNVTTDSGSRLRLCGKMCMRVYMRPRATAAEATEAVKEDILRSLRARLEMHCDSLVGEESKGSEHEEIPIVHEPPRRCLVGLPSSDECGMMGDDEAVDGSETTIMISDFLFPGETSYDAIDSVNEVFGFQPAIERMDDDQELVAGIQVQDLNMNGGGDITASNVTHTKKQEEEGVNRLGAGGKKHMNYNLIAIFLSVIVAIAGIAVSYLAMSTGTNVVDEDLGKHPRTREHQHAEL